MTNKNKLAILLATYNGELFLIEQLESLLKQTYKDFYIYIHDDGSIDNTVEIIEKYCSFYPNKIYYVKDQIKHRGPKYSFFFLLEHVEAEYYMFCDQDDIWLPNKIEITMKKMKNIETKYPDMPILVHTDLFVVDEKLNVLFDSFWKKMKLKVSLLQKFNYLATCNCVTGCTMLINSKAKEVSFPIPKDCPMHDFWIALKTSKSGIIVNVNKPTILYRQHGSNTVGVRDRSFKYFAKKLFCFRETYLSQKKQIEFCKSINYGSIFKFLVYKILYTIRRNFI